MAAIALTHIVTFQIKTLMIFNHYIETLIYPKEHTATIVSLAIKDTTRESLDTLLDGTMVMNHSRVVVLDAIGMILIFIIGK
jgi:hypothetical protein